MQPAAPDAARRMLEQSDDELLRDCDVHTYRASGPGGQKRNKTSSAVRLRHRASGLSAVGTESRSQHENKARALRRLREAAAVRARCAPPAQVVLPEGCIAPPARDGRPALPRLRVGPRHPSRYAVLALVLDLLAAHRGGLRDAAAQLGVSPSSVIAFLSAHPSAWTEAQRIRARAGRTPLRR